MIDLERIQRLAAKLVDRKDALEMVHQMRCGGKKYPGGGKFFRTNLQQESPLMYQPILPSYPDVPTPMRYEPLPHYGLYEYPSTTGMAENYPVTLPPRIPVSVSQSVSAPVVVEAPAENLFSDEMIARRALKQRYAESAFNDKAKSKAGAQGAWQIMPITLKDYLGRGRGKAGDLNDPEYNRKVRDWVMGIIPRDLKEFWSESDSDRAKLAKLYAAYNWGAGNLRGFLRKKRDAGIDISNPDNWVDDLNPETRRYVKYLAFDEDIPDSTVYTNAAFEKAAAERGYANGGRLYEMGGPSGPINPNVLRQAVKQTLLRAIPKNILVGAADLADNIAGIPSFRQIKDIPESGKFYTDALDNGESGYYEDGYIENPGLTFLLDRGRQSEMLQKMGYHPVNDGYYGSVTSATRKLNALKGDAIPIFQRGDDEVDFSEVEPVADKDGNYFFERTSYLGDIFGENELNHASYHPVSFYRHKGTGDIYVRGYDLNDYGKHDKNMWRNLPEAIGNSLFNQGYSYNKAGQTYGDEQYLAEIYDYIGNPFVQRTALVKAPEELVRKYFGEEYASGGKIRIKPENRGKFTALKKRTGHSASWFKAHGTPAQKKMAVFALNSRKWGNRKDEGGENLIAEYPEGYNGELRQGKSFNAWDRYLSNHPMVGHRLRKAKTLLLDAARVHPLTSFATDVYDSYVGPQDESDKITTPLGVVGRGGDIILNTVKQAGEIEPNMKKVFGRSAFGHLVSLPDFIDDSLKFVRDFAEPVTSFENGGYLLGHVYDLSEEQVNELIRQGYEVERV